MALRPRKGKAGLCPEAFVRGAEDLNPAAAGSILKESLKKDSKAELGAYLYALITANLKTVQEVLAMSDEIAAFDEWVEEMGWAATTATAASLSAWKKPAGM
jgi:hypothetical protein